VEQSKKEAVRKTEGIVLWTDRSRNEDELVGRAVEWNEDRWKKRRVCVCRQMEAFGDEMYAISEVLNFMEQMYREKEVLAITVFTDLLVAQERIQSD